MAPLDNSLFPVDGNDPKVNTDHSGQRERSCSGVKSKVGTGLALSAVVGVASGK